MEEEDFFFWYAVLVELEPSNRIDFVRLVIDCFRCRVNRSSGLCERLVCNVGCFFVAIVAIVDDVVVEMVGFDFLTVLLRLDDNVEEAIVDFLLIASPLLLLFDWVGRVTGKGILVGVFGFLSSGSILRGGRWRGLIGVTKPPGRV